MLTKVVPDTASRFCLHSAAAKTAPVDTHHVKQRQVVQAGGQDRHAQDFEVGNLQKLGDQESCRTHDWWTQDCSKPAGRQQPAGRIFRIARLAQHRVRD